MFLRRSFALLVLAFAQQTPLVIARDGWQAFPAVEYQGGDASQLKKLRGMLVLTDSALTLYECRWEVCQDDAKRGPWKGEPLYRIPLVSITDVSSSSQVRGAGTTNKLVFGGLANDRTEEFVGLVYETANSAEAPVFRTLKAQSGALEAKLRFQLKRLGVKIPEK